MSDLRTEEQIDDDFVKEGQPSADYHQTNQDEPQANQHDQWAELKFDEPDEKGAYQKQSTPAAPVPLTVSSASTLDPEDLELEAQLFGNDDEDDEPINIEVSDRPFQKKPLPKLMLGLVGAGLCAVAIGLFISAGSQDASRILAENSASTTQNEGALPSSIPSPDPRDQKIGELQSDQASATLKAKIDALNKRKEAEAKAKAKSSSGRTTKISSLPVSSEPAYSSMSVAAAPDPVPFRSTSRYSEPIAYSPAPRYAPTAQGYSQPVVQQQPKEQPKMLAFGGMPEESEFRNSSQSPTVQPVYSSPQSTSGYTTVAYSSQTQGFDTQSNALSEQQRAFLGGGRQTRISANASASGNISSGAILPGRFSVQIESPLSGIPAGTTMLFETKAVYPSGRVEAYAIGIVSGDYQRLQPIPMGSIALFSSNGKLLKAQRPGAGFLNSVVGRALIGSVQGAAGRFLATDSVISQTSTGTLTSQRAGGKGMSDLAAGALQGGLSPLLQSLPQGTSEDKVFSLEPGKKVVVKVVQPFTFSF